MLAVGAGGGWLGHFYSHLSFLSSFSLSLGDGPIQTEILSQRAIKSKTTNQPTYIYKAAKGGGWTLPFICCAPYTMGL